MKKILWLRHFFQISLVILVFLGLHRIANEAFTFIFFLAFIMGNFFCGWLCPLGTFQETLGKIGSFFLKKKIKIPPSVHKYAQWLRYLLLLIVLILTAANVLQKDTDLPFDAYQSFYAVFEREPLIIFSIIFLAVILILSLFINRPFCNYLCTNGIEYALPSLTRIFTVKRNMKTCAKCKICDKICPMNIEISTAKDLRNIQCINCFQCITVCPVKNTLSYGKRQYIIPEFIVSRIKRKNKVDNKIE